MRIEHVLSLRADARRPIRILVVGAGGTGSAITMGLPYLDQALRVWGRFVGLEVLLMDADTVSETNCIRQPFSISDIGQNKATVLVNRINLFWGTHWRAEPRNFDERSFDRIQDAPVDLLIGCVDINTIRAWLGHVSIDTTNIYVEIDLERKAQMLEKTNALHSNPVSKRPWKDNPSLMTFLRSL